MSTTNSCDIQYMSGFGNEFVSEHALYKGALHKYQNNPQKCDFGLIAEQLSGSAFTAARSENQRSWLYRFKPAASHLPFKVVENSLIKKDLDPAKLHSNPNQMRWDCFPIPNPESEKVDFVEGLRALCTAGHPCTRFGLGIYIYTANSDMNLRAFYSSDGDFLIVPQEGLLEINTEFGRLLLEPGEISVIQQGIRFQVNRGKNTKNIRGYICEVFGNHFRLPDLGPIGANGLANPRCFKTPVAWLEESVLKNQPCKYQIFNKYQNEMFVCEQNHSPFDVAAWHGNYAPYKYDLREFNVINTVSYDHADPSIFTVISCPSNRLGTSLVDLAIFPPRWSVAENTFRPPYYHRNCMSEFMGLVYGSYEAKETGFKPGGASLHNMMTPHGPDVNCFQDWSEKKLGPCRVAENTMSFMFESSLSLLLTQWADNEAGKLDEDYYKCWEKINLK